MPDEQQPKMMLVEVTPATALRVILGDLVVILMAAHQVGVARGDMTVLEAAKYYHAAVAESIADGTLGILAEPGLNARETEAGNETIN